LAIGQAKTFLFEGSAVICMPPQKRPYQHRERNLLADEARFNKIVVRSSSASTKPPKSITQRRIVGNFRIAVNASLHEIGITSKSNRKFYSKMIYRAKKLGELQYRLLKLSNLQSPNAMQQLAMSSIAPRKQLVKEQMRDLLAKEVGFASTERFRKAMGSHLHAVQMARMDIINAK
jgi:hypothetical protein